jgi:hypothetical protein
LTRARAGVANGVSHPACECRGDGIVVSLDRSRYVAPGSDDVIVIARCTCGGSAESIDRPRRAIQAEDGPV